MSDRIYLDNAATSWPKPDSVYAAIDTYQRQNGAAAGRGTYDSAAESARVVSQARTALKKLIHAENDSDLIFTFNGTDGLNLCLFGFLSDGDHVITSVAEHNSILRPLARLATERDIRVTYVDTDDSGIIDRAALQSACSTNTRLIAVTHASNVTGAIQPIDEIGQIAHEHKAKLLVDAAQTLAHQTINASRSPIDMLVASGHKGLMGPLGTGLVYLAPQIAPTIQPFRFGGTGLNSQSALQPETGPERFESGNLNMPGIAGMLAAATFHHDDDGHEAHANELTAAVLENLRSLPAVTIFGPQHVEKRVGLVSFTIDGYDCHDVAVGLDAVAKIEVRAGLHCAPKMHERLDVPGTVRASWGRFTTKNDIEALVSAVRELVDAT